MLDTSVVQNRNRVCAKDDGTNRVNERSNRTIVGRVTCPHQYPMNLKCQMLIELFACESKLVIFVGFNFFLLGSFMKKKHNSCF